MLHFCIKPHPFSKHFQLHYLRLPKDIGEDHVILMDCTVSTGAAAMMAVRVLLVGASDCTRCMKLIAFHIQLFFMGMFSFSGPWCTGGQNPAGVFANGWNGSPFSGLRVSTGQDHHHSCWQEGQWSLPHHTWHWWVKLRKEYESV